MNRLHKYILSLIFLVLAVAQVGATDVRNAEQLKNALGRARVSGNVVTLTGNVELSSPLVIKGGTMTLDLNGNTITYDKSSDKVSPRNDIAFNINGGNITVKNGTINVLAAWGIDYKYIKWPPKTIWQTDGSNAFAVVLNAGSVSLINVSMSAVPGLGGYNIWGNRVSSGQSWVVDAEGNYTLGDMLPNGTYFSVPTDVNYKKEGEGINQRNATVSLVKYTVSFNSNGGNTNPLGQTYTIETQNFQLPNVERQGYSFAGWFYNNQPVNTNSLPTTIDRSSSVNMNFIAKWKIQEYKVSYNTDGGDNQLSASAYTIEKGIDELPGPGRKPGYIFDGWYNQNKEKVTSIPTGTVGDITLTAHWIKAHTITYNTNGGSDLINPITEFTKETETFDLPIPTKQYYNFKGWYDGKDALWEKVTKGTDQDLSLTAKWQAKEYTLAYVTNANNVSLEAKTFSKERAPENLFPNLTGKKRGYSFDGWFKTADFKGDGLSNLNELFPNDETQSKVTIYAKWNINKYHVTFNTNDGKEPVTKEYHIESGATIVPDNLERKGYTFDGWYTAEDFAGDKFVWNTENLPLQDFTLYAKWNLISYPIRYEIPAGVTLPEEAPAVYTIDKEVQLPVLTRSGYGFAGWYVQTDPDHVSLKDNLFNINKDQTGERTFCPLWEKDAYTVTLELNGGTGSNSLPYTIEDEKTLEKPSRNGYTFEGWYKDEQFKEAFGDKINRGTTGNFTLYAKWSPIEYTIAYKLSENESFDGKPAKYTIEQTITLPVPVKLGYDFMGWYEKASSETLLQEFNSDKDQFGNKEFFARFETTVYEVTFDTKGGSEMASVPFTVESKGVKFKTPRKDGCKFLGWFEDEACTKEYGMELKESSTGNITLYAKWQAIGYSITYEYLYDGSLPANAPKGYTIDQVVTLPIPTRPGYTFVGWHDKDQTEGVWNKVIDYTFNAEKNQTGNKTFYAEWKGGLSVIIRQPKEGTIRVKNLSNNKELQSGAVVDAGIRLEIITTPSSSYYALDKIIVNGKVYGYSPCTVTMPDTCGLSIAATFTDGRPTVSKPEIITDPENVDFVALGQYVWVSIRNTDEEAQLLYSIGGSDLKPYTRPVQVTSATAKDLEILAVARKEGCKDGIQKKNIHYKSGKVTITFDLPEGIKAYAPDGGDVVSAVATGGMFEFVLSANNEVVASTEKMKVIVNGKDVLTCGSDRVYRLGDMKENVTITVKGVVMKQFTISLIQKPGGQVVFADDESNGERTVDARTKVPVKAIPDEGYCFKVWSDGNRNAEREVLVRQDTKLYAEFSQDNKVYKIVFPEIEGIKFSTLSAYSDEVKDGGTCKFYYRLDENYSQSKPKVYANDKLIESVKDVYSLYYIHQHYSISVTGIKKNPVSPLKVSLPENVECRDIQTGKNVLDISVYEDRMVMITAKAPEGKVFNKWNDNNKANPRMVRLSNAGQYLPMWKDKTEEKTFKLSFALQPGCGVAAESNQNAEAVPVDAPFKFRLNVLSGFSQSENIVVKVGEQELHPMTELRSSSASRTHYYLIEKMDKDMTVTVSGLKENQYQLKLEQTQGGKIAATTSSPVKVGIKVIVVAEPEKDYMFLRWSDGNTLNPYTYVVKGEATLKAEFIKTKDMVLDNETINTVNDRIYVMYNQLHVESSQPQDLFVYSYSGALIKQVKVEAGHSSHQLPTGDYVVRLGKARVQKIFIK